MHHLMDEIQFEADGGTVVRMIKKLKKSTPGEKAKAFIFGEAKTETEASRPNQREPQ